MIQGAKNWNGYGLLYTQENNAFEILVPGLEYCGATAAVNCLSALYGGDLFRNIAIQPEDYLTAFLLNPSNIDMFKKILPLNYGVGAGKTPPNRVRNLFPYAVEKCFGARAEVRGGSTFESVARELWNGNTVELCIPGHYIAAVAYNDAGKIGFKDSWAADTWPEGIGKPDADGNRWFEKRHFDSISREVVVYFKQ